MIDNPQCPRKKESSSALWILQMAQKAKAFRDTIGKPVFFCVNFYTRHNLASMLKQMTNVEAKMIGPVKFTILDWINQW